MSDDECKVVDIAERLKRKLPVAPEHLRDVYDIVTELLATMDMRGMKYLYGSFHGGWTFSIQRQDSSGNGSSNEGK